MGAGGAVRAYEGIAARLTKQKKNKKNLLAGQEHVGEGGAVRAYEGGGSRDEVKLLLKVHSGVLYCHFTIWQALFRGWGLRVEVFSLGFRV